MNEAIEMGWQVLQLVMIIGGLFTTLLGILTVFYWVKTPKTPSDTTNRINNITAWWIGLTRPSVLAGSFPFFTKDVLENIQPQSIGANTPHDYGIVQSQTGLSKAQLEDIVGGFREALGQRRGSDEILPHGTYRDSWLGDPDE